MPFLVDTNVILRWAHEPDPAHALAEDAIATLGQRGEELYVTPQNLIEFWNVATRPMDRNGFGLTPAEAGVPLAFVESFFRIAPDHPAIYGQWRRLVAETGVSGVQVHDARLAAVMLVHGLTHILTFNTNHFQRYPGITAVHPQEIAATS